MTNNADNAAYALKGKTLNSRWEVVKLIPKDPSATGGFFSVPYLVKDITTLDGQLAFLKALNFKAFFQLHGRRSSITEILSEQTSAFNYEKSLLNRCRNSRLSKISVIVDEGEEYIDGFTIPNVPFLVFELADGDIRSRMDFSSKLDLAWKLSSLHNVAVGLNQLHSVQIGHQDLKPSNILLFDNGVTSKIGDLGRSLCKDIRAPHENGGFTGDFTYAPPESLYGYDVRDWNQRISSTDIYLFGSLMVFYFTGVNMTALIGNKLSSVHRWGVWGGDFQTVLPYLTHAFASALDDFEASISYDYIRFPLREMVSFCCNPDPNERGHPANRCSKGSNYSFERIISGLSNLKRKVEIKLL